MKTESDLLPITWEDINRAFAPFAGSCLYAIRAEAFFHFALRSSRPGPFRLKNAIYPAVMAWRSLASSFRKETLPTNEYLLVCDYAAEPGFGTLRPLLDLCEAPATLVVNSQVLAARGRELACLRGVHTICADTFMGARHDWPALWRQAHADFLRLLEVFPLGLQPLLVRSRRVLQTLLVRAYLYGRFYEELFAAGAPRVVITHNDFTALSYLAGEVARRMGIPDFTLQHGFPSQEYFPASASHYLVWGPMFQQAMSGRALNGTRFVQAGAPRLDGVVFSKEGQAAAREKLSQLQLLAPGKLHVLFLSQSHTPVFSSNEHDQILSVLGSLAEEPWIRLLVRQHPQESRRVFRTYPGFKRAVVLTTEISLAESILASDVVISVNSTAMLEAALLHAPVVQLALPSFEDRLGMLRFPSQAKDRASLHIELWRLRNPDERAACVREQQPLIAACVHEPGRGAAGAWRYIRAHAGENCRNIFVAEEPVH